MCRLAAPLCDPGRCRCTAKLEALQGRPHSVRLQDFTLDSIEEWHVERQVSQVHRAYLLQVWWKHRVNLSKRKAGSTRLRNQLAAKIMPDSSPTPVLSLSTVCLRSLLWNPSKAARWLPPVVRLKETSASSMYRSAWSAGAATGEVGSAANWVVAMTEAATPGQDWGIPLDSHYISLTKIQSPLPSLFVTWVRCF